MQGRRYVKHRDRPVRRLSPREDDETDAWGRLSPEVEVENYGEGTITADIEPAWPQNFETGENILDMPYDEAYLSTGTSSQTGSWQVSERAQKYVVSSFSLKDLTGDKFITVPEPRRSKTNKSKVITSSTSLQDLSSPDDKRTMVIPSAVVKPVPRAVGSFRGYPAFPEHTKSHTATVRVHPRQSNKLKRATIKAIPHDGTIRTIKSYSLAPNATLRLHSSAQATKLTRQQIYSLDGHTGTLGFKRGTTLHDRKEYCFSQFGIELDRPELDTFKPGEVMTGRVILEANSNVEIRFVELLIVGLASVQYAKTDPNVSKDSQEILFNKRSYIMGSPDGHWNSIISAGRYVSRFKFALPENLPSTIKYESRQHGFSFEVGYLVKARICDDIGSSSLRSTHSTNNYVKVLMSRRHSFYVRRPFDIHSVPKALMPVNISEFVNLSCMPLMFDSTSLTLSLDRSVFLAGDEIRVKLITSLNAAEKIKSLTCELHQKVFSNIKPRQMFTIQQVHEEEPEGIQFRKDKREYSMFEFILPTHSQFIPSFLIGTKLLKVTYSVLLIAKFRSCSGKVFLESPVGIGPCADPMNLRKTNAVPIFNRPKRFPHFSRDSPAQKLQNGTTSTNMERQPVNTTHKSVGCSLFCCCLN